MSDQTSICPRCSGSGYAVDGETACGVCHGSGEVRPAQAPCPDCATKDTRIAELETKLHDAIWALKGVVPSGGVSVVIDELQTAIKKGEAG